MFRYQGQTNRHLEITLALEGTVYSSWFALDRSLASGNIIETPTPLPPPVPSVLYSHFLKAVETLTRVYQHVFHGCAFPSSSFRLPMPWNFRWPLPPRPQRLSKKSGNYLGKVRTNLKRTEATVFTNDQARPKAALFVLIK